MYFRECYLHQLKFLNFKFHLNKPKQSFKTPQPVTQRSSTRKRSKTVKYDPAGDHTLRHKPRRGVVQSKDASDVESSEQSNDSVHSINLHGDDSEDSSESSGLPSPASRGFSL